MSTVVLDTITGKSTATTITIGSTPVVSASANSMTIRGEGTAQTSIQQGLAKAWVNFDGTGTVAIRDSYNVSSITDNGTANWGSNYTTALVNTNYCVQITGSDLGTAASASVAALRSIAVGSCTIATISYSGTSTDRDQVHVAILGDLA